MFWFLYFVVISSKKLLILPLKLSNDSIPNLVSFGSLKSGYSVISSLNFPSRSPLNRSINRSSIIGLEPLIISAVCFARLSGLEKTLSNLTKNILHLYFLQRA